MQQAACEIRCIHATVHSTFALCVCPNGTVQAQVQVKASTFQTITRIWNGDQRGNLRQTKAVPVLLPRLASLKEHVTFFRAPATQND